MFLPYGTYPAENNHLPVCQNDVGMDVSYDINHRENALQSLSCELRI